MVLECVTGGDLFDRIVRFLLAPVTVLLVSKRLVFIYQSL